MRIDHVWEAVTTSFFISGAFGLVLWMLGAVSGFLAIVAVIGLTTAPLLNHFLAPR